MIVLDTRYLHVLKLYVQLTIEPIRMTGGSTLTRARNRFNLSICIQGNHSDELIAVSPDGEVPRVGECRAAVTVVCNLSNKSTHCQWMKMPKSSTDHVVFRYRPNITSQQELVDSFQILCSLFKQLCNSLRYLSSFGLEFNTPQTSQYRRTWNEAITRNVATICRWWMLQWLGWSLIMWNVDVPWIHWPTASTSRCKMSESESRLMNWSTFSSIKGRNLQFMGKVSTVKFLSSRTRVAFHRSTCRYASNGWHNFW